MSKNKHKNHSTSAPVKQEQKEISAKELNPKLHYIVGSLYFLLIVCISFPLLYVVESQYTNLIITVLFLGYFATTILLGKKIKKSWVIATGNSIKLLCAILGIAFLMNFAANGLDYINKVNIQSQNVFDIETYSEEIYKEGKSIIYADSTNGKVFIVDNKKELNKVSEFPLYKEEDFSKETLTLTKTFFDLTDNLRFSYITNNIDNEIIIQWTKSEDDRYLAIIDASLFVDTLKTKDNYDKPFIDLENLKIYQSFNPSTMLVFADNYVSLTEFDTITDVKDTSYIDRVYTFLQNHYDSEFIQSENATGELLAEYHNKDYTLNVYSINCVNCEYRYGKSEIAEIIKDDESYMFRLEIDSSILKEVN